MIAYRIILKKYSDELFAPGVAGRWNGPGRKVVYCAQSIALAFLEKLLKAKGNGFNDDYKTMIIEIPDNASLHVIHPSDLDDGWREGYTKCQPIGNKWYSKGKELVLKVPSAVLPDEYNFVINSTHSHFNRIRVIKTIPLIPDERIEDILKKYPGKK